MNSPASLAALIIVAFVVCVWVSFMGICLENQHTKILRELRKLLSSTGKREEDGNS